MRLKSIITATFGALLLVGCQNDDHTDSPNGADGVVAITASMTAPSTVSTRNGVQGDNYLGNNLSLSIYTANPKYQYHNTLWTKTGASWSCSEGQLLWEADTKRVSIYAYAPHVSTGVDDLTQVPFDVKADQTTAEAVMASDLVGYTAIDQTVGSLLVNNMLPVELTHRMAKLKVVLTFGDEFADLPGAVAAIESVEVQSVKCQGTYNAKTGQVAFASNTQGKIVAFHNTTTSAYEAIIIPQSIAGGSRLIRVNLVDGRAFAFSVPATESYDFTAANSEYTLTLRVGKDKLEVNGNVTVAEWGTATDLDGGTAESVMTCTLADIAQYVAEGRIPEAKIWVITDNIDTNTSLTPLSDLLKAAPVGRKVSLRLPNATALGFKAFYQCDYLSDINIPKVTTIGNSAFSACNSLSGIVCPEVTEIGEEAFFQCLSLSSIVCPKITVIGNSAFFSCISLLEIDLSNATEIGDNAFFNCRALADINLPNATALGNKVFSSCINLARLTLATESGALTTVGTDLFGTSGTLASNIDLTLGAGEAYTDLVWRGYTMKSITQVDAPTQP